MRPSLGLSLDLGNCEVTAVKAGGLAFKAGIAIGDIVISLDDQLPVSFFAGVWWPRDDRPILAKVQRGDRQLWRVLMFDEPDPAVTSFSTSVSELATDPFAGIFTRPAAATEQPADAGGGQDRIADLRRSIAGDAAWRAELKDAVAAIKAARATPVPLPPPVAFEATQPSWPPHLFAGPLTADDLPRHPRAAADAWRARHGV
jgi:hypothetical protein